MSTFNDPENWRTTHCPVHYSPLDFNGRCPLCDSLERSLADAVEIVATISRDSIVDLDEEDCDYEP